MSAVEVTVHGQVSNAATTTYLDGARIVSESDGKTVYTSRGGYYDIRTAVPTVLTVTYLGLDTEKIAVEPGAPESLRRDVHLTSNIYKMDPIRVSGPREGSAAAIIAQRNAANLKNVVAADTFGNIPDGNIGDFLQHIPGVTPQYNGDDIGSVQIRGIDPALNSVTLNGEKLASTQIAGSGGGRDVQFYQLSLGFLETLEVIKAPTPDMDADSIGGAINLITKSAFDREKKRFGSYTISGVYRSRYKTRSEKWYEEPIKHIAPALQFTYADRYGRDERLGVLFNASFNSSPGGDTAAIQGYPARLEEPYWIQSVAAPRPAGATRTRFNLGTKIDYKLSERTTISLNASGDFYQENNDTRTMTWGGGTAASSYAPGYSGRFTQVLPSNNSVVTVATAFFDISGRTLQIGPAVKHRFNDLLIEYSGSISDSRFYRESADRPGRNYPSGPKGTATVTLRGAGWTIDRTEGLQWPKMTQTAGPDVYNIANYSGLLLLQNDFGSTDSLKTARLNVTKKIKGDVPSILKAGGSFRTQERQLYNNNRRFNYTGPSSDYAQFLFTGKKWTDSNYGYHQPPWLDSSMLAEDVLKRPQMWNEDVAFGTTNRLQNDRGVTETVIAGYLMGDVRISRLYVLGGVRVERTETDADGPLQVGGAFVGRQNRKGKYQDVFPGLHLKYDIARPLLLRASYSTSVGRPAFDAIMPLDTVSDAAQTINTRNASLQPQFSNNFDVGLEYYFEPVGLFSVSAFLKELTDFQFSSRGQTVGSGTDNGYGGQYAGYTIITTMNGGRARYRGLEFAYQQQLTFLPGIWRGLGVAASYTRLDTYGDYGGASATNLVANFAPEAGTLALTYVYGKYNFRVSSVYRGEFLSGLNASPTLLRYETSKTRIDAQAKYKLNAATRLFFSVTNLNNSPVQENWLGSPARPNTMRVSSPKYVLGVEGTF